MGKFYFKGRSCEIVECLGAGLYLICFDDDGSFRKVQDTALHF